MSEDTRVGSYYFYWFMQGIDCRLTQLNRNRPERKLSWGSFEYDQFRRECDDYFYGNVDIMLDLRYDVSMSAHGSDYFSIRYEMSRMPELAIVQPPCWLSFRYSEYLMSFMNRQGPLVLRPPTIRRDI